MDCKGGAQATKKRVVAAMPPKRASAREAPPPPPPMEPPPAPSSKRQRQAATSTIPDKSAKDLRGELSICSAGCWGLRDSVEYPTLQEPRGRSQQEFYQPVDRFGRASGPTFQHDPKRATKAKAKPPKLPKQAAKAKAKAKAAAANPKPLHRPASHGALVTEDPPKRKQAPKSGEEGPKAKAVKTTPAPPTQPSKPTKP